MDISASSQEWLLHTIRYFRSIGFFETHSHLSDHELAAMLRQWREKQWGKDFDPSSIFSELGLLSWDKDRVWWKDTEADVCSGRTAYKRTITEWSNISRGTFLPENIQETWRSEQGPIEISCIQRGRLVTLHPEYLEDYIDLGLLVQINALISDTGMQFELYKPFDQTGFVLTLTADEKRRLQTERGWHFAKGISNS